MSGSLEVVSQAQDRLERLWEALYFPWHRRSAALILLMGQPARTMRKYGARGYRLMLLEAGAVLQNLGLVAAALGLHGSLVGTPFDAQVEEVLQLDPDVEIALAGFAAGVEAPTDAALSDERGTHGRRSHELDRRRVAELARPGFVVDGDHAAARIDTGTSSRRARSGSARGIVEIAEGAVTSVSNDLAAIPRELWPSHATIRAIREAGHVIEWRRQPMRSDEPHLYTYVVRLGASEGGAGHPTVPSIALDRAVAALGVCTFLRTLLGGSAPVTLENVALRFQSMVLQRSIPRLRLRRQDRIFRVSLSWLWPNWQASHGPPRDRRCLASPGFPILLALEVPSPLTRSSANRPRDPRAHPPRGPRQPDVGLTPDSGRTPLSLGPGVSRSRGDRRSGLRIDDGPGECSVGIPRRFGFRVSTTQPDGLISGEHYTILRHEPLQEPRSQRTRSRAKQSRAPRR